MATGFLHLHVTIVSIFILLYLAKVYLLLANKTEALDKLRSKTKIADMVLGSLILITGGYLTFIAPKIETYLIVKIVLVLASIPVGIVAMKKANKPMAIIALLIYFYVFAVAKQDSLTLQKEKFVTPVIPADSSGAASTLEEGRVIFEAKCALCHGKDGKLMLNNAKDLSVSKLGSLEIIEIVSKGKGLMPGFSEELDEKQMKSLTIYVEGLRK
ncbi:MAG: c-type cytochrome [Cytophaga sp.]|uniref:c-type cytochrome n=1 Tax=Cytophaga sp. TaxID=29535 RepID=UPI003F7D3D2E